MRLTVKIREEILLNIRKDKINKKLEKIKNELSDFSCKILDEYYSDSVQDWIDRRPSGALTLTSLFKIKQLNGYMFKHELLNSRAMYGGTTITTKKNYAFLACDINNVNIVLKKENEKDFNRIVKKLDDLLVKQEEINTVLKSAIYSCNTKQQLEKNYPSLLKYLPKIEPVCKQLVITNEKVEELLK